MPFNSLDAFKVSINDLRHSKCKVTLEMKRAPSNTVEPYCSKCDAFIHTADIEINPNPETQNKVIEMIKIIGALDWRLALNKKMREKEREHRIQTKPVKDT